MTKTLKVVCAQLNFEVGNLQGNLEKHLQALQEARDIHQADVILFPELSLPGYPPEDLLLRRDFLELSAQTLEVLTKSVKGIHCIVGHPQKSPTGLLNACSLIHNGKILATYAKQRLPNYDEFDELRYFVPDQAACVVEIKGFKVGLVICEDLWQPEPVQAAKAAGAQLILTPNASPFETDKHERRLKTLTNRARETGLAFVYVNQVGGQDELLFDGGSMAVNGSGELCGLADFCKEGLYPFELTLADNEIQITPTATLLPSQEARVYAALCLGLKDYVRKNGFPGVIIGLSGGIDSALTLALACDALGKNQVHAVFMPSEFTADISREDAHALCDNFGLTLEILPITTIHNQILETLTLTDKTALPSQNIQARIRAILLMAQANKTNQIVITTSNRSETAVGYTTIYGDMAGGFALLKDVPKTMVYALVNYRNELAAVIPERILTRAPSAELSPNQKDEDSLPPYAILDQILWWYLNKEESIAEIVARGFEEETVKRIATLIKHNEYKRRQAPVGVRINYKAFGKDRRYPITTGYKG